MSTVRPGDVLAGKYRVERVLGSGGMGYVVAARHLQLDQLVAMKFLRKGGSQLDETEATGRFLREAKAVVRLKDEHVARVFDVGTLEGGEPYIVMEYLDGQDLSALTKARGALPVQEAVDYILQSCEALAEAHSLGIVHRDVKLANLFVTRGHAGSPLVKVLDFGISKVNPFGESEHEMTRTSSMLGSPRFMSPEQMRDPRTVDPRSDIWSLGVVLYRLVSARPPFEADTLGRLLTMVMHEAPDPLAMVRPDLPPGFSETVGRCLEKDPAYRYPNVAELAYALAPYAADPVRARAAADRAAGTLNLAQLPRSGEIAYPRSQHGSGSVSLPAGQSDTGTAAPWVGTHGEGRRDPRNVVIWAATALAALAGVILIAVALTRHPARPAAAGQGADPVAVVNAPTAVANPGGALVDAAAGGAFDDPNGAALTPLTSPSLLPRAPAAPVDTGRSRAAAVGSGGRKGRPAAAHDPAAPTAKSAGDGIPSTRD
ncbi:MAG: Serine/threonine protein kinase PrkC, regulator of stationary phase [Labilithrix sp.]|nr:Serine/threonine protein kinase PrkC, regulator of stationary phase [Labilithrix sp.]